MEEKSCFGKVETTTGKFTFTVEGWSTLSDKVGDSTESPEFDLCGKKWQLRIFPGGSLENHCGYISYYLASKSTTLIRASYKLIVRNQNPASSFQPPVDEMFASAGIRKFEAKGVQVDGWGRDKFMLISKLKDSRLGFCMSDTVIFQVEVVVFGNVIPVSPGNLSLSKDLHKHLSLSEELSELVLPSSEQLFADVAFSIRVHNTSHNHRTDSHDGSHPLNGSNRDGLGSNGDEEGKLYGNEDVKLYAHKCILSARSPVFCAMFNRYNNI